MNLLFSFGNLIRPTRGGTERVTYQIANGLRSRGHRVFFLITEECVTDPLPYHTFTCAGMTPDGKAAYADILCEKLDIDILINEAGTSDDVYFLNTSSLKFPGKIITCIHFDIVGDLQYFYRCYRYPMRSWKDAVRLLRLPWLKRMHTRNRKQRYRHLLRFSDAVVVPAPALKEQLFRFSELPPNSKVRVIPNPAAFEPEWQHTKEKTALFVGRLSPEKHVDHLLRAWKRSDAENAGWQLLIVGDGALRDSLENLSRRLKLQRVFFMGQTDEPETLYRRATLLLLPSDHESFSLAIQEALSFGCFPISYDFPALSQLLAQPEWGLALRKHSPTAMAKAIRESIRLNRSNLPHQQHIHSHLNRFALPGILDTWEQLFSELP